MKGSSNNFCILTLNENFEEQNSECFSNFVTSEGNSFLKCIHLTGEVGAFTLYHFYDFPFLLFKKHKREEPKGFENYLSRPYIFLDLYTKSSIYFNDYCLKNDFIKITEKKLCFITSTNNNETLYISILNIINSDNVIIRYYSIDIFQLYNYKILLDMRGHL